MPKNVKFRVLKAGSGPFTDTTEGEIYYGRLFSEGESLDGAIVKRGQQGVAFYDDAGDSANFDIALHTDRFEFVE